MAESATPVVVAAEERDDAEEFRHALADVTVPGAGLAGVGLAGAGLAGSGLADVVFPGRAIGAATSLEDVITVTAGQAEGDLPDAARDLGVVVILRRLDGGRRARVASAHYVRPIERDGAGHIQRRPPVLLAAWNEDSKRLDHFAWGSVDELATRALTGVDFFQRLRARRRRLLNDLAAARVFDRQELRAQIERAALTDLGAEGPSRPDARN
jgi:hypothetical protein